MLYIQTSIELGITLKQAVEEAIELSNKLECGVRFQFNDTRITIEPRDTLRRVAQRHAHYGGLKVEVLQ